jgi:hypothetical protein
MIAVVLQDENGKMLSEQVCIATNVLSHVHDTRFTCLRFVDPYGDTIFNRLQMTALLDDLHVLRQNPGNDQHENILSQIETLVQRGQSEPHIYIKFIGD